MIELEKSSRSQIRRLLNTYQRRILSSTSQNIKALVVTSTTTHIFVTLEASQRKLTQIKNI